MTQWKKKHRQQNHRGRMKAGRKVPDPTSFTATGPNQVWSWDISYCPSAVRGQHWYLYRILDIYSRKIVAWEVHDTESGLLAKQLVERALLREGCWHKPPVLHSDNCAPMTSHTFRARLAELGMPMSHSRPRVPNVKVLPCVASCLLSVSVDVFNIYAPGASTP